MTTTKETIKTYDEHAEELKYAILIDNITRMELLGYVSITTSWWKRLINRWKNKDKTISVQRYVSTVVPLKIQMVSAIRYMEEILGADMSKFSHWNEQVSRRILNSIQKDMDKSKAKPKKV